MESGTSSANYSFSSRPQPRPRGNSSSSEYSAGTATIMMNGVSTAAHGNGAPIPMNHGGEESGMSSWQYNVANSFSSLASQIQAVSQSLAAAPAMSMHMPSGGGNSSANDMILAKLHSIELEQQMLREELAELKARMSNMTSMPDKLEKRLDEQVAAFNADQLRMPARLHNATCVKYPMLIKPVPISANKFPKNFPATKGEFEHLTKERYENIMQEYGIVPTGDTDAKREQLRNFLGLPAADEPTGKRK